MAPPAGAPWALAAVPRRAELRAKVDGSLMMCAVVWRRGGDGALHADLAASYAGRAPTFLAACGGFAFEKGQGIPGRCWVSRRPELCPDVRRLAVAQYKRLEVATFEGVVGSFAVPCGDDAVLELCSSETLEYCIRWRDGGGGRLSLDRGGTDHGRFAEGFVEASAAVSFARGEGLVGRCWASGGAAFCPNVQLKQNWDEVADVAPQGAATFKRLDDAMRCGIRGVAAMCFGGDTVLEFGTVVDLSLARCCVEMKCQRARMLGGIVWRVDGTGDKEVLRADRRASWCSRLPLPRPAAGGPGDAMGTDSDFARASFALSVTRGDGAVGRCWRHHSPQFHADVQLLGEAEFPRLGAARRDGVRGLIAVPVSDWNGEAVVEFALPLPLDWACVWRNTADLESMELDLAASYPGKQAAFVRGSAEYRFPRGAFGGLPGRAWADGVAEYVSDVRQLPAEAYHRLPLAKREGVRATCVVAVGGDSGMVVEFGIGAAPPHL